MAIKKTITEGAVKKLVAETAKYKKAKLEIWKETVELNNKLDLLNKSQKKLNESFGFDTPGDASKKTKTGFVNDVGPISSLTSLGAEIQEAHEAELQREEEEKTSKGEIMAQLQELKNEMAIMKSNNKKKK